MNTVRGKFPRLLLSLAALLALAPMLRAAGREFSAWAQFEPGAWIELRLTQVLGEDTQVSNVRRTLIAVRDEHVELNVQITMDGAEVYTGVEEVALLPAWCAGSKTRDETIQIAGRDYACEVWDYKIENGMETGSGTVWYCPSELTVLRSEVKTDDKTASTQAVKMDEWIEIDERKYLCILLESTLKGKDADTVSKTWVSRNVPGATVRSETTGTVAGKAVKQSSEATALHVPARKE